MDQLIVGAAALVAVVVAVLIVGRIMAGRAESGTRLQLTGDQPEVTEWLPVALHAATGATAHAWSYEVVPMGLPGGPPEYRAEVRSPSGQDTVTVRVDSTRPSGTFTPDDPVRVMVRAPDASRPGGPVGAVFGAALTPAGRMQTRVVRRIRKQDHPVAGRVLGRRAKALIVAVVVAAVAIGGFVLVRDQLAGLANPTAPPTATPSAKAGSTTKRPARPKASKKACAVVHKLKSGPKYSAVNADASCGFAENIRKAYVAKKASGQSVKLGKVTDPQAKKTYTNVKCSKKPVICVGGAKGAAKVWLYG